MFSKSLYMFRINGIYLNGTENFSQLKNNGNILSGVLIFCYELKTLAASKYLFFVTDYNI